MTRQCLARWLERSGPSFRIVAAARLDELDEEMEPGCDPELVVLSIGAASVTDPSVLGALDGLALRLPGVPPIILADREDAGGIVEAIRRGVRGYIPTTVNLLVAVEALKLVQVGGTFVPAGSLLKALEARPQLVESDDMAAAREGALAAFTPRQQEVLSLLREGKSNKIIAYELAMQESTVKVHVRHIMRKLQATNRTQAAFLANQLTAVTS